MFTLFGACARGVPPPSEVNLLAAHTDRPKRVTTMTLVVKGVVEIGQSPIVSGGGLIDRLQPGTSCPELREDVGD